MRYSLLGVVLLAACSGSPRPAAEEARASEPAATQVAEPEQPAAASGYDPALAERLGADEYGMAQYVMAFLKAGPNRDRSPEEAAELQRAHLANITRLAEEGKLVLAGPFMDSGELRGIYIFDVQSIEEARALTESDPAIAAGSLVMELRPWFGSAALREVNAIHERIAKTRF